MPSHPKTTWVILAGGQARRMGGQDKGLVTLNQKPLIDYVHQRLTEQGANIAINANRNQETYQQYGPVFGDVLEGFPGPLGGMHAAMSHLDSEWIGFVPCDCPNLPHNLIEKLVKAIEADTEIVVAHDGESVQPVVTMMKRDVFERLDRFLANGDRKIVMLYDLCTTRYVDFSDEHDAFINLNTPDELEKFGALS
ncbi:molybdenum cofactor guanylyltransferase MobA [Enterovibrio norvegicus FF-33]|uniref:Molybdenum cofactor guanylyltransferase n=1 Tax=Enterovibrio norvegicus FF-454 TaxID=1185651 RepID=A0A1E5C036_9GAMM|nr:molybdenum cofactor guanylyltransferase MobA [Enterovibrio norvegicus]OEE58888.1 molybdenum cofactor guanylyltransferase MobA [Enterovibrio norvegicus FF-454]OEE67957.1 molybdenum cofactor guanylyltransferase MobA [Enterovibrio norvegicus FF-33]